MTLSRKTILVIISTFIALVFIVATLSDVILLSSYRQLEKKNIVSHIEQVYNQIQNRLEQNDVTARDIAIDIVGRLQKHRILSAFDQRYFSEDNLKLHRVDLAAIYDADGHLVVMRGIYGETGTFCPVNDVQQRAVDALVSGSREPGGQLLKGIIAIDGKPFMVSLKPLSTSDGILRGSLLIGCFLDRVELERIYQVTGYLAILTHIASAPLATEMDLANNELVQTGGYVSKVLDESRVAGYSYLRDVHGQPSFIVKITDTRVLFQQGKTSIYYILLVLIVCGAIFCGVMLLFVRGAMLNRLATLIAKVGDISRHGDISERLEIKGEDELEDLAGSINSMLASLESTELALRESENRYRALFERAPDAIIIIGTEGEEAGRIVTANKAAAAQHGYSVEELCSLKIFDLNTPETNLVSRDIMRKITNGEWVTCEMWHFKKDGSRFPIEVHAGPLTIDGRTYILGFDRDITSRKLAEESDRMYLDQIRQLNMELGCKATELEAANRELESFNYSVSHDMRGPLTRISGYSQLMLEDDSGGDPQMKTYLSRIYESSCWLNEMIDALLKLSQLARTDFVPAEVNLSAIVEDVLGELTQTDPSRALDVVVETDVKVIGDALLLKVLMCNLINNSWKYCAGSERTHIEFGVTGNGVSPVYYVRDNGVGFDMKDADKLFRVFTRLHDPTQFSGSGIGLATVQRVIARHGGRVWAEGEAGSGATFFFTLAPDDHPV